MPDITLRDIHVELQKINEWIRMIATGGLELCSGCNGTGEVERGSPNPHNNLKIREDCLKCYGKGYNKMSERDFLKGLLPKKEGI